jgi:hypothetical protein
MYGSAYEYPRAEKEAVNLYGGNVWCSVAMNEADIELCPQWKPKGGSEWRTQQAYCKSEEGDGETELPVTTEAPCEFNTEYRAHVWASVESSEGELGEGEYDSNIVGCEAIFEEGRR